LFEAVRWLDRTNGEEKRIGTEVASSMRWTPEERLAAVFDAGKTSAELAKLHKRSRAAIEARLLMLGKIDASALTVQLRCRGAETR
jgi:hypothetical protein